MLLVPVFWSQTLVSHWLTQPSEALGLRFHHTQNGASHHSCTQQGMQRNSNISNKDRSLFLSHLWNYWKSILSLTLPIQFQVLKAVIVTLFGRHIIHSSSSKAPAIGTDLPNTPARLTSGNWPSLFHFAGASSEANVFTGIVAFFSCPRCREEGGSRQQVESPTLPICPQQSLLFSFVAQISSFSSMSFRNTGIEPHPCLWPGGNVNSLFLICSFF